MRYRSRTNEASSNGFLMGFGPDANRKPILETVTGVKAHSAHQSKKGNQGTMLSSTLILATLLQTQPSDACTFDARSTAFAATRQQDTKKVDVLKIGDPAPDFSVDKWNGGQLKLTDRKDKVAVITFWNTTMPQSKLVINHLQELNTKIKADQPLTLMYINTGDDSSTYADWMNKNAGHYAGVWGYDPMGRSAENSLAWKTYGAAVIPTTFVVDVQGRVFAIISGYNTGDARYVTALKNAGIKID